MITMDMIGKVRRMKLRDQLSLSEISKRTGLARNTVKKWLNAPGDEPPKYERRATERKLTAFEGTLMQALAADAHRPKQSRRSVRALFSRSRRRVTGVATARSRTSSGRGGRALTAVRPRLLCP